MLNTEILTREGESEGVDGGGGQEGADINSAEGFRSSRGQHLWLMLR